MITTFLIYLLIPPPAIPTPLSLGHLALLLKFPKSRNKIIQGTDRVADPVVGLVANNIKICSKPLGVKQTIREIEHVPSDPFASLPQFFHCLALPGVEKQIVLLHQRPLLLSEVLLAKEVYPVLQGLETRPIPAEIVRLLTHLPGLPLI